MKKNRLFIVIVGMLLYMVGMPSCAPDYETEFEVKTLKVPDRDLAPVHFTIEGGQKEIQVETNVPVENWRVESNADWCKVEKSTNKVVISANRNDLHVTRIALVTVSYGHQSYNIPVSQLGLPASILVEGETSGVIKEVGVNGGEISVVVESNVVLDYISIPDTAAWVKLAEPVVENGTKKTLKFMIEPSYDGKIRYSTIMIQSSEDFSKITSFVFKQDKRVWGEPVAVPLTLDMLSANATQAGDGQGLPGLIDNNKNTFYHTLWSGASPGGKPHYVQINLTEPLRFIRIDYHGRNGGNGAGDVKRAGIWVSETGGDNDSEWAKAATITYDMILNQRGALYVAQNIANLGKPYKYIRFIPEARRNADPIDPSGANGWWNMADMFLQTFAE